MLKRWLASTRRLAFDARCSPRTRRFLVVQIKPNPTTDYYLRARLPADRTVYRQLNEVPTEGPDPDTFVVLCRYVTARWLDWLERHRSALSGIALFLDDSLDAALFDGFLPIRYRRRIWNRHHRHIARLNRILTQLWVSVPYLSESYARCDPLILPPVPPEPHPHRRSEKAPPIIACHGTEAHAREAAWLVPIMRDVLAQHGDCRFQISANGRTSELIRSMPRTELLEHLSWPAYQAHCLAHPVDIALAPLVPTELNAGRSHTKVFDIARLGAAGVYSKFAAYPDFVRDGVDGLLVGHDPDAWRDAIGRLLSDAALRTGLQANLRARLAGVRTELLSDFEWAKRIGYEPDAALA